MKLATLLGWGLAASLLAACSGGGSGSVAPASGSANDAGNNGSFTQGVALKIDAPINLGPSSVNRRSPKFIGTNVNTIAYTFTPGPISGTFTSSGPGAFTGCTASGSPVVQTCDVTLAPGTYAVTVTLKESGVDVGSGTAAGITITSGNVNNFAVDINPVNSVPSLIQPAMSGIASFYNDGTPQLMNVNENELDPAGDIITTYYGPVANYPTLTMTDSGATTNITLPVSNPISVAPSGQNGYINQDIAYTGSGNTTQNLNVSLSDGTSTSSLSFAFVSLGNNADNPSPGQVTFSGLGAGNTQTVTITESTTSPTGVGLDGGLGGSSSVVPCGTHASFSPAIGGVSPTQIAGSTATLTYTITANDSSLTTCELDVNSPADIGLTTPITINFPGTLGVGVGSHARR